MEGEGSKIVEEEAKFVLEEKEEEEGGKTDLRFETW